MKKIPLFTFVKVCWQDAQSHTAWIDHNLDNYQLANITTVGILVKQDKKMISIALNYDKSNISTADIISIPIHTVNSITILKDATQTRKK